MQPPFPPRPRPTPPGGGIMGGNPFAGTPTPPLNIPGSTPPKPRPKSKPKAASKSSSKGKASAKKAPAKKK